MTHFFNAQENRQETATFHYYQVNSANILGGLYTYSTLSEAMDQLGKIGCNGRRITKVYCVTLVDSEWWHGKYTGYLCEEIDRGLVYSID